MALRFGPQRWRCPTECYAEKQRERETRWTDWIKLPFVLSLVSGAGLKYLHVFINFSDFWIYSGEQDDGVCDEDDFS